MIKIDVFNKDHIINKVIIKGHALYDDYGKDIVCASVSSIYICTVNAILRFGKDNINILDENDEHIINVLNNSKDTQILLTTMIDLLKHLENDYPKNIEVVRRK